MNINVSYEEDYIHVRVYCSQLERLLVEPYINFFRTHCECHNPFCSCVSIYQCECFFFFLK